MILRCKASLVSLARTKGAGGERRGEGAPAFRVCRGNAIGPEPKPRAADAFQPRGDGARPHCRHNQMRNGPIPSSGAISQTRHQASASFSVVLRVVCLSGCGMSVPER